jgi:hypothetical protein
MDITSSVGTNGHAASRCTPQKAPLDIGAHVFAWHTPESFNRWAQRNRGFSDAVSPIGGCLISHTQGLGKRGGSTGQINGPADAVVRLSLVHHSNSTLIDLQVQQMLDDSKNKCLKCVYVYW